MHPHSFVCLLIDDGVFLLPCKDVKSVGCRLSKAIQMQSLNPPEFDIHHDSSRQNTKYVVLGSTRHSLAFRIQGYVLMITGQEVNDGVESSGITLHLPSA